MNNQKNNTKQYAIQYDLDFQVGAFKAEDIIAAKNGGTDAIIFCSILFAEDGSYSQQLFSIDGRNEGEALLGEDLFKFWALLSHSLAQNKTLSENKRKFCEDVFEEYRRDE